jgi:hypothetical protein
MKRYSAMLLFQFRVVTGKTSNRRRVCEKRLVLIKAPSARKALAAAKRKGKAAEHRYENSAGGRVYFEFVGVMDLLYVGWQMDKDEVWYDMFDCVAPMERKKKLIPPENELNAIRLGQ